MGRTIANRDKHKVKNGLEVKVQFWGERVELGMGNLRVMVWLG